MVWKKKSCLSKQNQNKNTWQFIYRTAKVASIGHNLSIIHQKTYIIIIILLFLPETIDKKKHKLLSMFINVDPIPAVVVM